MVSSKRMMDVRGKSAVSISGVLAVYESGAVKGREFESSLMFSGAVEGG
jgi:hypothetical protein